MPLALRFILPPLLCTLLAGQVNAESVTLATTPFDEDLLPTAKISGEILVGALEHRPPGDALKVQAYVPADWAGDTMCVRVVSVDGFYTSQNAYTVADTWGGGFTALPYPTEFEDRLLAFAPQGVGVRVTRGTCDAPPVEFTLARWNEGALTSANLLVNPLEAEAVFAYIGGSITPVRCEDIALPGKSAFHVACDLTGVSGAGPLRLELLRVDGNEAFPSDPLILWMPSY